MFLNSGLPVKAKGLHMQKVLIVDDNTTLAYFTARNLERDIGGLAVSTAASCGDARRKAAEDSFSVIIVDINLSDGCGTDLVEELVRQSPETSAILISGETLPQEFKSDIFGFLRKPYEAPCLSQLVQSALSKLPEKVPETSQIRPKQETGMKCDGYNSHHVRNQLSSLLAGLRSFGADLRANACSADSVNKTVDEYVDRLCGYVHEVTRELPVCRINKKPVGN
jgi:response regulator of citrate/malate metabolism